MRKKIKITYPLQIQMFADNPEPNDEKPDETKDPEPKNNDNDNLKKENDDLLKEIGKLQKQLAETQTKQSINFKVQEKTQEKIDTILEKVVGEPDDELPESMDEIIEKNFIENKGAE